jgi:competence protein ComEA
MPELTKEQKVIVLVLIGLVVMSAIYSVYAYYFQGDASVIKISSSAGTTGSPESGSLIVHISGAVNVQGVFKLAAGSRVIDAINAAGGPLDPADLSLVNLAESVKDGSKIIVPFKKKPVDPVNNISVPGNPLGSSSAAVNINNADAAELQKIPGVGVVTARKIIDYRNSKGPFLKPEDIKNIGGIGEKKFARMKDSIVVN